MSNNSKNNRYSDEGNQQQEDYNQQNQQYQESDQSHQFYDQRPSNYNNNNTSQQSNISVSQPGPSTSNIKVSKAKVTKGKKTEGNAIEIKIDEGMPRSNKACLACRKLKTRCDGADDPPCKRCRNGGHECIFVESKRGKRPPRKATDMSMAEKFKTVESSLSSVLSSLNSGIAPDPEVLLQLQSTLADGIATEASASSVKRKVGVGSGNGRKNRVKSPSSDEDFDGRGGKRSRQDSTTSVSSHYQTQPQHYQQQFSPSLESSSISNSSNSHLSPGMNTNNPYSRLQQPLLHSPPSHRHNNVPTSLSILADASLAAEIDGRSQLTGLDATFNLSSITQVIQAKNGGDVLDNGDGSIGATVDEERTPGILRKGIVDPETAVELFRIFFDYAYIHLPLLDPDYNSATSVCTRSPFLFTVICAVASRFHSDPLLHIKCYDEAHLSFVDCVANGERSIESVQACMILTVWTNAPKGEEEDRPKRAWLYFGMAVRMGLELGLFRPPAFVDAHLTHNSTKANPWVNLKGVSEEEQREALNRERTWLMVFVIDRNMSAVMGRPYQIHEAKPLLIPLHPMSLPFDLGVIAHQELQSIIGQVMDTFRDRIYGLSSASDEMPSAVVMKLFNSRMDEWRARWCPVAGEPIANNLLFYFYSSKLFLNTFPLHTMLRSGDAVDDPECVSTTINAAKAILDLGHKYAELGVLRHCPDVNFLLLLYAAVFLIKVKASKTRFAQLVESEELQSLMLQSIFDCQQATCSSKHAASTCMIMLRALYASWKAMSNHNGGIGDHVIPGGMGIVEGGGEMGVLLERGSGIDASEQPFVDTPGTLGLPSPSIYNYTSSPFSNLASSTRPPGTGPISGTQTPTSSFFANGLSYNPADPLDNFLNDTHFFNSVLVSQGQDGFFSWAEGLGSASGIEFDGVNGMNGSL